jgi:hypothetical protein
VVDGQDGDVVGESQPQRYLAVSVKDVALQKGRMMSAVIVPNYSPLVAVMVERAQQIEKWGEQNHDDLAWLAILTEEVGEAAECVCKTSVGPATVEDPEHFGGDLEREVIQIAAVAVAWVEAIKRRGDAVIVKDEHDANED